MAGCIAFFVATVYVQPVKKNILISKESHAFLFDIGIEYNCFEVFMI